MEAWNMIASSQQRNIHKIVNERRQIEREIKKKQNVQILENMLKDKVCVHCTHTKHDSFAKYTDSN